MPANSTQSSRPADGARGARIERKRIRLLDAAGYCFAHHGFAKTTVEEIARAAGISKGLVYSYFDSKESLLEAVLDRALREWSDLIGQEVRRRAGTIREALGVIHRASLEYARSHPLLAAILAQDPSVLLAGRVERLNRTLDEWREALSDLLRRGIEEGELRRDLDVGSTAEAILILNKGFIERAVAGNAVDPIPSALTEAAIDLQLYGVAGVRPATPPSPAVATGESSLQGDEK